MLLKSIKITGGEDFQSHSRATALSLGRSSGISLDRAVCSIRLRDRGNEKVIIFLTLLLIFEEDQINLIAEKKWKHSCMEKSYETHK